MEQVKHIIVWFSLSGKFFPSSWTVVTLLAITPSIVAMDEYILIYSNYYIKFQVLNFSTFVEVVTRNIQS
jgi:hypothetical protein